MQRVPDSLKELSLRLVHKLQTTDQPPVTSLNSAGQKLQQPSVPRGNIAIWEPRQENGRTAFVRAEHSDPWRLWADTARIEPKSSKSRVVLMGESVARGFLLDPYFNCAMALESLLKTAASDDVEVVDLAKCGLSFSDLRGDLPASLALEPDVYIIFAGNNWHIPYTESLLDFREITRILQETDSWAPVSQYVGEVVKQQIRNFVRWLGRFSAGHKVPIIFIIPETNLMDWQPNDDWQTPLATDELRKRRFRFKQAAEKALADGDVNRAMALATEQLLEPDEELNPLGFEILAECKLRLGELNEARQLKEKARDIPLSLPVDRPPRCYSAIQEVIRHEGPLQGLTIVDLPKKFQECFPDCLPDRRFFLDHCHLSIEGIRFAMACVTEKLLGILGKPEKDGYDLNSFSFQVDRRGIAQGHIAAAFEYAVHHQNPSLIRHHLMEAIRQEPGITDLLHILLEWHVRPYYQIKYITELENLLASEGLYCIKFPLQTFVFHPGNKPLYPALVECLIDVLAATRADIRTSTDLLLKRELGVTPAGIDLLNPSYLDLKSAQHELSGLVGKDEPKRTYFKSYGLESGFHLICAAPCKVRVSLTCRVPNSQASPRPVQLLVNGVPHQAVQAVATWRTWDIEIPAHLLGAGENSLIIRWPELNQSKAQRADEVVKQFPAIGIWGNYKDIYSVYGEVHEFKAYHEGL